MESDFGWSLDFGFCYFDELKSAGIVAGDSGWPSEDLLNWALELSVGVSYDGVVLWFRKTIPATTTKPAAASTQIGSAFMFFQRR